MQTTKLQTNLAMINDGLWSGHPAFPDFICLSAVWSPKGGGRETEKDQTMTEKNQERHGREQLRWKESSRECEWDASGGTSRVA